MARPRGAFPSPRHRLASATPHKAVAAPPQFLWFPAKLSMWGNATYGDCCSAEEAAAKATNLPEIFIPDADLIAWASANGFLNGATLIDVIDAMVSSGIVLNGVTYKDGPPNSVDWTDAPTVQSAIAQGPIKIGVAADQLEAIVPDPPTNGWVGTGFSEDSNLDHCTGLLGYGPFSWLAGQLGADASKLPADTPCYAMFSWSSVGILDIPSFLAITGEAWLRSPTNVVVPA